MKRRLNACQIYIFLQSSATPLITQDLKIAENKLFLNSSETAILLPFSVIPGSLSGLTYKENIVTFRIRFIDNLPENRTYMVHLSESGFFNELKKLSVGERTNLMCFQCGFEILNKDITIRDVSFENEIFETSDMFCHGNKKTLFENGTSDLPSGVRLLYENGSVIVNPFDMSNLKCPSKSIIRCARCFSWLGVLKNDNAAQFWLDSVKILDVISEKNQENVSTQIFLSVLEKTVTSCLFPICNIMLVCKVSDSVENRLLISVMDRNVLIYEYDNQENLSEFRESIFLKVLFKELNEDGNDEGNIHGLIYVSKSTLCTALRILYSSAKELPYFDAEEKIAYLRIK